MGTVQVVDPVSLVAFLWNVAGVDISEAEVRQYWKHHRENNCPWAIHSQADDLTMPLALYGDGVKLRSTIRGQEKMVGIFLSCPLFRPRSVRCSRWLLAAVQEELLYKHHTLDTIFCYLTWALNKLWTGKWHSSNGPALQPLSKAQTARAGEWVTNQQWCFQVTELRGDWLWHRQVFRFQSSWKAGTQHSVCFKCPAFSKGSLEELYYNISENAPFWAKEYDLVDWLANVCPAQPCAFAFKFCFLLSELMCLRKFRTCRIRKLTT